MCGDVGVRSKRLEPEHTDVEALTDVSGTDASYAQTCAAVWTCTRGSLRFCVQYLIAVTFTVFLLMCDFVCVCRSLFLNFVLGSSIVFFNS